jgi:hypothetical protein
MALRYIFADLACNQIEYMINDQGGIFIFRAFHWGKIPGVSPSTGKWVRDVSKLYRK